MRLPLYKMHLHPIAADVRDWIRLQPLIAPSGPKDVPEASTSTLETYDEVDQLAEDFEGSPSLDRRSMADVPEHKPHENCPDSLDCLPDTDSKPQHTLPIILRSAILGSKKKKLTIRDIYSEMERKYPYFKTAGPAWKVRGPCPLFMLGRLTEDCAAIRSTSSVAESALRASG